MTKSVSEELLCSLIASNIESLQRAGYRMLKHIYINSLPELQYPAQEKWDIAVYADQDKEELKEVKTESKMQDGLNKNIPMVLIEMVEKVPSISGTYHDVLKETKRTAASVESLISEESEQEERKDEDEDQYALIPEMYGYLLSWNVILDKVYYGWLHSRKSKDEDYLAVLNSISVFLDENKSYYEMLLVYLTAYLPANNKLTAGLKEEDIIGFDPAAVNLRSAADVRKLSLYCLFNFMKNYPSLARTFYAQCDPVIGKLISNVVTKVISPTVWYAEVSNLRNCQVLSGCKPP